MSSRVATIANEALILYEKLTNRKLHVVSDVHPHATVYLLLCAPLWFICFGVVFSLVVDLLEGEDDS